MSAGYAGIQPAFPHQPPGAYPMRAHSMRSYPRVAMERYWPESQRRQRPTSNGSNPASCAAAAKSNRTPTKTASGTRTLPIAGNL